MERRMSGQIGGTPMTPSGATVVGVADDHVTESPASTRSENFRDFYHAHVEFVWRGARRLGVDDAAVDDVVQHVFLVAYRRFPELRLDDFPGGRGSIKAWVFAILRNEFYSRNRREWRQVALNDALGATIAAPPGEQHWALELSDTAYAMRGLSDPQREALILVGVGGFSQDDAASLSKVPIGTVKSRLGRARKALKEILDKTTSLPIKSRPSSGDAMNEILAQLSHR